MPKHSAGLDPDHWAEEFNGAYSKYYHNSQYFITPGYARHRAKDEPINVMVPGSDEN